MSGYVIELGAFIGNNGRKSKQDLSILEVRCGERKSLDMCEYAKWKLVLQWLFRITDGI